MSGLLASPLACRQLQLLSRARRQHCCMSNGCERPSLSTLRAKFEWTIYLELKALARSLVVAEIGRARRLHDDSCPPWQWCVSFVAATLKWTSSRSSLARRPGLSFARPRMTQPLIRLHRHSGPRSAGPSLGAAGASLARCSQQAPELPPAQPLVSHSLWARRQNDCQPTCLDWLHFGRQKWAIAPASKWLALQRRVFVQRAAGECLAPRAGHFSARKSASKVALLSQLASRSESPVYSDSLIKLIPAGR